MPYNIRSFTWAAASISWSWVMTELLKCFEKMGNKVDLISTNGYDGTKYYNENTGITARLNERQAQQYNIAYDLDITFTVPVNWNQRFLTNSKLKCSLLDYESSVAPANWSPHYNLIDYVFAGSNYCADMFRRNGCPESKLVVVPHGINPDEFNHNISPYKLSTEKKFKFLCVAEPHYRKQLDRLLEIYCREFTAKDDVCLVMKTKLFGNNEEKKPFEQDLRTVLLDLKKRYGNNMPEIKFVQGRIPIIGSLYTACDAFVLPTASEGFGVPFLEAVACGLPVIAPRHGGQMDFLNDSNSLLFNCGVRKARRVEQYWGYDPRAVVGNPDEDDCTLMMRKVYRDSVAIRDKLLPGMIATANQFTWENAATKILSYVGKK